MRILFDKALNHFYML